MRARGSGYNAGVHLLLAHSDARSFEPERFGAAWQRAGGGRDELVAITPATAGEVLAACTDAAGLLLTGGPDVEPWRYGATPMAGVTLSCDAARDALDLELLARAERQGWPVLAVCYGLQILNVSLGGTLVQDLDRAGLPGHSVPEPKDFLAHRVACTGGRWLRALPTAFAVNSRHHQALDRVAPALAVTAAAGDGVVEAVELAGSDRFVVGVQWHPENLAQREHVDLFRAFRDACARAGR